jgi:hypothetical protein
MRRIRFLSSALVAAACSSRGGDAASGAGDAAAAGPFEDDTTASLPAVYAFQSTPDEVQKNVLGDTPMPSLTGAGASVIALDGDSLPDIALTTGDALVLLRNVSDGSGVRFREAGRLAFQPPFRAHGVAAGDIDADGTEDVVAVGEGGTRVLLVRNGGADIVDATPSFGIPSLPGERSTTAAVADVDRDGMADVVTCGWLGMPSSPSADVGTAPMRVLIRRGPGFVDAMPASLPPRRAFLCGFADFDGDGVLDVYASHDILGATPGGPAFLPDLLLKTTLGPSGQTPQLHQVGDDSGQFALGGPATTMGLALTEGGASAVKSVWAELDLLRIGSGVYTNVSTTSTSPRPTVTPMPWGSAAVDIDGDGTEEVVVAFGAMGGVFQGQDLSLPVSQSPVVFTLTRDAVVPSQNELPIAGANPMNARGVLVADFDADGDPDLLFTPAGGDHFRLYKSNRSSHWLRIAPIDAHGHPAMGTRVEVSVGGSTHVRQLATIGSPYVQSEPALDFGLASATAADSVVVHCAGGTIQVLGVTPADRVLRPMCP